MLTKLKLFFLNLGLKFVNNNNFLSGYKDSKNYNIYLNDGESRDEKYILVISTERAIILNEYYFNSIHEILHIIKGVRYRLEKDIW